MARAGQSITYLVDFEAISTVIGAIEEAAAIANTDRYIAKLINAAHAKVADEFDAHIVADAMTTNTLNHMFEWGTTGINTGRTTRRISPTSQEAKLWEHVITGTGKSKTVAFKFLPSKVPVPKPTTAGTGINQKYLSKLKGKNIFWNKAAIMETGAEVRIAPKNGGKLFIPLAGFEASGMRSGDYKRGFIMTPKAVTVVPGGRNIGTFTAYWEKFWQSLGQDGIAAHMQEGLNEHLEKVLKKAQAARGGIKPASPANIEAAVKKGKAIGSKTMIEEADRRERKRKRAIE